ncbi:MAG: [NiFe]-hydrogenase assembly chaperone HybE [Gammaproteobacteria bacterium]|nr:[NiFe]-hydrogenase assembly chaperone HybE [Gammaproteobacteria bacterium]
MPVEPLATTPVEKTPIIEITSDELRQKEQQLETLFKRIHVERMADVPITNEDIKVTAVGFQQWENSYLGILVTPWFMNLMLLPGSTENWDDQQELSKKKYCFPSGRYTFLTGFEPDIGKYQTCSLFSPMYEFADNDAAVDTATFAIKELLNIENVEQIDIEAELIEDIWNGTEQVPEEFKADGDAQAVVEKMSDEEKQVILEQPTLAEKIETPISRRDMLRGSFLTGDKKS